MKLTRTCAFLVLFGLVGLVPISQSGEGAQAASQTTHASMFLDCNGYGLTNNPARPSWHCTDIRGADGERFEDNGHYVGHDEPQVQFFSTKPGSGNSARYDLTLPKDPSRAPDGTVDGPVWNFQIHAAPWFSMVMCDTESFPETTKVCVPNSDTNIVPETPTRDHAGTAFMEFQFYPPGANLHTSCDKKYWCAALTIDSVQIDWDGVENDNCIEPQSFAYVTKSGRPTDPTLTPDVETPPPSKDVLRMKGGDRLTVSMYDTKRGFKVRVIDRTTGKTGTMTAGASNGWRHVLWDPDNFTCETEPYTFHPMFSTAAPPYPSGQPRAWPIWSAHGNNIAMSDEIGHFEAPHTGAEEPCYDDPPIPGCLGSDFDFDGYSYQPVWPDGKRKHPGPFAFTSPKSRNKHGDWVDVMNKVRFETDLPAFEYIDFGICDFDGTGCINPPPNANFYPWFHTISLHDKCYWTLSNDLPHQRSNFGGEQAAWGPVQLTDYGDSATPSMQANNFASSVRRNPCRT